MAKKTNSEANQNTEKQDTWGEVQTEQLARFFELHDISDLRYTIRKLVVDSDTSQIEPGPREALLGFTLLLDEL